MKAKLSPLSWLAFLIVLGLAAAAPARAAMSTEPQAASGPEPEELLAPLLTFYTAKEPVNVIVVEKTMQRLKVFEHDRGLRVIADFPCATGEGSGRKETSGDSRTPEGIYFITKYYKDNKITIFGNRAFHLDYPNSFDVAAGRNGDGIYIHGTNRELAPNSTNGCITMANRDLDRLSAYLEIEKTPVLIVESLAKARGNILPGPESLGPESFGSLLLPETGKDEPIDFETLYLLRNGRQTVAVGEFFRRTGTGEKTREISRAYLAAAEGEGWQAMARLDSGSRQEEEPAGQPRDTREIIDFLERWRQAWQGKRMDDYIGCYAKSFVSQGKDLAAWRRYKEGLSRRYSFISVDIKAVRIDWSGRGALVSFDQTYRSDQFRAAGRKTLSLVRSGRNWLIEKESFSGKGGSRR